MNKSLSLTFLLSQLYFPFDSRLTDSARLNERRQATNSVYSEFQKSAVKMFKTPYFLDYVAQGNNAVEDISALTSLLQSLGI